jgi:DUF4097 and DUF4098 domain-containing protein YvlB
MAWQEIKQDEGGFRLMEERKMILKMIEEGKITAEEGAALLEALEQKTSQRELREEPHSKARNKSYHRDHYRVKKDLHDATEKVIHTANKGANKLLDLIGKAVDKIQTMDWDLDFDFNFSGGIRVTEKIILPHFAKDVVLIGVSSGSVKVRTWEHEDAQIFVNGVIARAENELEAKAMLKEAIKQKDSDDEYAIMIEDQKGVRAALEIFLPYRQYTEMVIDSSNGSVKMDELEVEQLKIETSNGSVRLYNIYGRKLHSVTSNGKIQLKQSTVQHCQVRTSNGSVYLEGELSNVECETTNGSIRIEQEGLDASDISATTSNGSIRVLYRPDIDGVYGEIRTNHGQTQCALAPVQIQEEVLQGQKWLKFNMSAEQKHHVHAVSKTGSIYIGEREAY